MIETKEVAKQSTLEQKVEKRDHDAKTMLEIIRLAKTLSCRTSDFAEKLRYPEYIDERDIEQLRKSLDAEYWHEFFQQNQVEKYLTSSDAEKMYAEVDENPIAFNSVNANNMLASFIGSKEATAMNMVKKIYKELTNAFFRKSGSNNIERRIQKNVPMSLRLSIFCCYSDGLPSYVSESNSKFSLISDLERACYLVDGKLQPDVQKSVTSLTTEVLRKGEQFVDAPYFKFKIFKNGNIKLDFKSQEVLDKLNKWGETRKYT